MSAKEVQAFLKDNEKNWVVYHLVRCGHLPGRDTLEEEVCKRLVREKRCRRLDCAMARDSTYVHCEKCREKLIGKGYASELANMKDEKPSLAKHLNSYSETSLAVRITKTEVEILPEDWVWEGSSEKYVHAERETYQGNSSPEDMV
ncbi:hypothetical protein FHETE_4417 [Fusarium heterosporum]|uniref:Uncharacterized protein n=1 Tax=Fusarium heterosporum TaxID=42747 RepID=A0A8H5TE42_FUSHE|nr:hypothetical protein FHETE_4417 [Fusarium heterosporum]